MTAQQFPTWCRLFNDELKTRMLEPSTVTAARYYYEKGNSPKEAAETAFDMRRQTPNFNNVHVEQCSVIWNGGIYTGGANR